MPNLQRPYSRYLVLLSGLVWILGACGSQIARPSAHAKSLVGDSMEEYLRRISSPRTGAWYGGSRDGWVIDRDGRRAFKRYLFADCMMYVYPDSTGVIRETRLEGTECT